MSDNDCVVRPRDVRIARDVKREFLAWNTLAVVPLRGGFGIVRCPATVQAEIEWYCGGTRWAHCPFYATVYSDYDAATAAAVQMLNGSKEWKS